MEPVLTVSHDSYLAMVLIYELSAYLIAYNQVHLWAKDVCGYIPTCNRVIDNPLVIVFLTRWLFFDKATAEYPSG